MGISVFPVPVGSSGGATNFTFTTTLANKAYDVTQAFASGVYKIDTSPTSSQATVTFYDTTGATILKTTTVSGTVTANMASAATGLLVTTTSTSTAVTISYIAAAHNRCLVGPHALLMDR